MLNSSVLVLNRLWQPVNITSVRRAFGLLYGGRVRALDDDYASHDWDGWIDLSEMAEPSTHELVHSISVRVRVPRVVQLLIYDRIPRPTIKFTRSNIYLRDRYRCQYCGRRGRAGELNIDHLIPRSRGGTSNWENVVVACVACNRRKGNHLPEEVGMFPMRSPHRPRWHPAVSLSMSCQPYPQWRPFLEFAFTSGK
ncbi:MAG: HNH endonuclease [Acidobacteriota bacterium]